MVGVEQPIHDSPVAHEEEPVLVDLSDLQLNTSSASSNNETNTAQLQEIQNQQYHYTQHLLEQIERLRNELDQLSLQVS